MKANELMIDDWVLYEGEPYQIRKLGIYGVDRDGEDYPAVCVGKPIGISLIVERNEIEPIPLTAEILEKNEFHEKWDRDIILMECDTITIEIGNNYKLYKDGKMYLRRVLAPLYYVHQLQHALRLCGIEKEIVL